MNLDLASIQHKNVCHSLFHLFLWGTLARLVLGDNSITTSVIVLAFFVWHGISIFQLGKNLGKNKITWAIAGVLVPFFVFIPTLLALISANKIFKKNNWKVKWLGGAVSQEKLSV